MFEYEQKVKAEGFNLVIDVDEAGRGPLAGPVVASAVAVRNHTFLNKICDSKKINSQVREKAFLEIFEKAYVGVGIMSESTIDAMNILQATHEAMSMAVTRLLDRFPKTLKRQRGFPQHVCLLIDGNSFKTHLPYPYQTIVRGDESIFSISCASIVAKVVRDRILNVYDHIFPRYGFKQHKGYPTKGHREALRRLGPSPIHRKTFRVKS